MVTLRAKSGLSLVELLLVIAILGILAMVGPRMIISIIKFYQLHTAKLEIQRDARVPLDIVNRFLRQAKAASVVIDQISGQPPASRVSFTTLDGQNMVFYQRGTSVYQVARSTAVISQNLHYLAFTYPRSDDPTIISVAITMAHSTYEGGSKALELSIEKVRIMN
jgi:prepilin-type N-terminal cleavage/methylation domain-containing protein